MHRHERPFIAQGQVELRQRRVDTLVTAAPGHGVARRTARPSGGAPVFLRRAARESRRHRDRNHADLVVRLVDVTDLTALAQEIGRGARTLARAVGCELVLWRDRDATRATVKGVARRRTTTSRSQARGRRAPEGHLFAAGNQGESALLLGVRHGGRTLAYVRVAFRHVPSPARIEALRRYLAHAGAALARIGAEERLHRQRRRYGALLDSLPDACLLVLSPQATITDVRGRAPQLVGDDPARLVGMPLASDGRTGLLRISRPRLRSLLAAARDSGRSETESVLRVGERDVFVSLTLVDLGSGGELVGVLRDLTAVKAMENALLLRNDELTRAAERLREMDVLKNEFLSNVSHELRTPLTAIIAYTETLLVAAPDPATQREFLRVVCEQGQKLQRLIAGLLDMSRLESLATELKLECASLNDVVRSAIVTVQPTADKNRIGLRTELDPALPSVYLDELRAQQIVWNLLTNAIKFSATGTTITVRTWSDSDSVWAAIADQGVGIAPEHQKLVFEKFVQLDGSSTRRQGGVGLGLDLVRHLVDLHGGIVKVDSIPGEGSTFTFNIPLEKRRRPRLDGIKRVVTSTTGA